MTLPLSQEQQQRVQDVKRQQRQVVKTTGGEEIMTRLSRERPVEPNQGGANVGASFPLALIALCLKARQQGSARRFIQHSRPQQSVLLLIR